MSNGSFTVIELNAGANTNDTFTGMNNVTYGGTLQITNQAGTLTNGSAFTLFSATNYVGAFSSLSSLPPGPGLKWDASQLNSSGTLRAYAATSPPPIISSATLSGSSMIFSATGFPYDVCIVLSTTNATLPLSDWTRLRTNNFDVNGTVNFTNAIPPGEPQRYFRLAVE